MPGDIVTAAIWSAAYGFRLRPGGNELRQACFHYAFLLFKNCNNTIFRV
jgi:hypothetical protein